MPRPLTRNDKISIVFMIVWLIFWAGGMMVMTVALGGAAMAGDFTALAFMVVWLVAASFGLRSGARGLRRLLMRDEPASRRPPVNQPWNDGMTERPTVRPAESARPARNDDPPREAAPGRFDRL